MFILIRPICLIHITDKILVRCVFCPVPFISLNGLFHYSHKPAHFYDIDIVTHDIIGRTWCQPNYSDQLAPKRGSQRNLNFNPNPTRWAYRHDIATLQARDILSRRSYQPNVLTSLWSRLWWPEANCSNFIFSKCKNSFRKQINCAHIDIFHKLGYWFKIRMEFLRPILSKIELICQQPAMTRPTGVIGMSLPAVGYWMGWLGAVYVICICVV